MRTGVLDLLNESFNGSLLLEIDTVFRNTAPTRQGAVIVSFQLQMLLEIVDCTEVVVAVVCQGEMYAAPLETARTLLPDP